MLVTVSSIDDVHVLAFVKIFVLLARYFW